jgi:hypothetical protein
MQRTITKKSAISAIGFLDKRSIMPGVIDEANDAMFLGTLEAFNRKSVVPSNQWSYRHFVNSDLLVVPEIDAVVSGNGTTTVAITITNTGFARQYVKFKLSSGQVVWISSPITTASGKDSFTIKSVNGTNVTVTAGDKLSFAGLTVGEKSKEVENLFYDMTSMENNIEIFREIDVITDVQKAAEVEVTAADGSKFVNYTQHILKAQLFKLGIEQAFIVGQKSVTKFSDGTPALSDADGSPVQTTGGVDEYVASRGVNDSVATLGTLVMDDYDDLFDRLIAVKSPSSHICMGSEQVLRQNANLVGNLGGNGLQSVRLELDGSSSQDVVLNVQKYTRGQRSLEFMNIPVFNHPQLNNFAGSGNIQKSLYGMPKDQVKTTDGIKPRIGVRYMTPQVKNSYGNETTAEFYTGALALTGPTNDEMVCKAHWISNQGLECLGTKQFFKLGILA